MRRPHALRLAPTRSAPRRSLPTACIRLPARLQVVHTLQRGAYHFYCTQTPWVSPLMFRLATQQNAATRAVAGAEKTAFAWCAHVPPAQPRAAQAAGSGWVLIARGAWVTLAHGRPR